MQIPYERVRGVVVGRRLDGDYSIVVIRLRDGTRIVAFDTLGDHEFYEIGGAVEVLIDTGSGLEEGTPAIVSARLLTRASVL